MPESLQLPGWRSLLSVHLLVGSRFLSAKCWSSLPPRKTEVPLRLNWYWEMRPLGFSGGLQYSSTVVELMTMCRGVTQTPGRSDTVRFQCQGEINKHLIEFTASPLVLWHFYLLIKKISQHVTKRHFIYFGGEMRKWVHVPISSLSREENGATRPMALSRSATEHLRAKGQKETLAGLLTS